MLKVADPNRRGRAQAARSGLTLVELIGVLAVITLAVALMVPAALRHLDRLAAEEETRRLELLASTLQAGILRADRIPSHTDWAQTVASEGGYDLNYVTQNARRRARAFVIDGAGWLSTNVPYVQTNTGTAVFPGRARVMLVSSLGRELPIGTGILTGSDFENLWNSASRTVPNTSPWTTWTGDPEDVLIQRVNLSPLFVRLVLGTYNSATNGQYAIPGSVTNLVPYNAGFSAYFLKGTVLNLYSGPPTGAPDATQVLNEDRSFVYEGGMWRDTVVGKIIFGAGDMSGIVAAFLAATPNTNAKNPYTNAQQILVVGSMVNYLSNYNAWAALNFPKGSLQTALETTLHDDMMDAVRGLFSTAGSYTHYPTNASACP